MKLRTTSSSERLEPSSRQLKVGEEIRHIIAQIFVKHTVYEPRLEKVALTVTEVRMSSDLKQAKAFIITSAEHNLNDIISILNERASAFRGEMSKQLSMKFMPRILFRPDLTYAAASLIEDLLRSPHVAQDLIKFE